MLINNFDPVAIQIFSIELRWYSLAYIGGIVFGWILGKKFLIKDTELKEKFDDYISYIIIGIIVGGRLGYVLFYNFSYYLDNPIETNNINLVPKIPLDRKITYALSNSFGFGGTNTALLFKSI